MSFGFCSSYFPFRYFNLFFPESLADMFSIRLQTGSRKVHSILFIHSGILPSLPFPSLPFVSVFTVLTSPLPDECGTHGTFNGASTFTSYIKGIQQRKSVTLMVDYSLLLLNFQDTVVFIKKDGFTTGIRTQGIQRRVIAIKRRKCAKMYPSIHRNTSCSIITFSAVNQFVQGLTFHGSWYLKDRFLVEDPFLTASLQS